jgi:hypothetical protein
MEQRTKTGLTIGGGVLATGAVVAALVHWWPSSAPGEKRHGGERRGHKGPGASGATPDASAGAPPSAAPPTTPSPSIHDVAPSTAAFVPGAERLVPVAKRSHWHAFKPGSEVATLNRSGHFVQLWHVGPDGVTLTAAKEPLRVTPELVVRASADLHGARLIGPHAHHARGHRPHHDPHRDPHMGALDDRGSSIALAGVLEELADPRIGLGTVASMATRWSYYQSSSDGVLTTATNVADAQLPDHDAAAIAAANAAKVSAWRKRGDGTMVRLVEDVPTSGGVASSVALSGALAGALGDR